MRQKCTSNAKRIVVKVGSAVITTKTGRLDSAQIKAISSQIAALRKQGFQVVLVTSGAIAAGLEKLGIKQRPAAISELQALASVGQGLLMQRYTTETETFAVSVGQVLLTQYDIQHREHYVNASNTFEKLFDLSVLPIVNENDTTVVEEIKYGDNDTLAALVTNLVKADALIIMSDIDGLYTSDPRKDKKATLVPEVKEISADIEKLAGGAGTAFGSGGMVTKLNAAKIVTFAGAAMFLVDGKRKDVLVDVMKGLEIGTFFAPKSKKMASRKAWIAFGTLVKGSVTVDDGAKDAILNKGKSLLAAGVIAVSDGFEDGDTVDIVDRSGVLLAKGLVNVGAAELNKIKGMKSKDIEERYGQLDASEVVHRDCLVVLR